MMVQAINPSILGVEQWQAGDLCEFQANLFYVVSFRAAGAILRPCFKNETKSPNKDKNNAVVEFKPVVDCFLLFGSLLFWLPNKSHTETYFFL